jgi:hypothetical protein
MAMNRPTSGQSGQPTRPTSQTQTPGLRASFVGTAACGVALAVGALLFSGPKAAISTSIGVIVAELNLWALARTVSALLSNPQPAVWIWIGPLKMLALFAVVGLLMRYAVPSPLSMVIGFGALPMGIAIVPLMSDRSAP